MRVFVIIYMRLYVGRFVYVCVHLCEHTYMCVYSYLNPFVYIYFMGFSLLCVYMFVVFVYGLVSAYVYFCVHMCVLLSIFDYLSIKQVEGILLSWGPIFYAFSSIIQNLNFLYRLHLQFLLVTCFMNPLGFILKVFHHMFFIMLLSYCWR